MIDCEFCRLLTGLKNVNEYLRVNEGDTTLHEYTALLNVRSYQPNHKKQGKHKIEYRQGKLGYPLNYCPVCGRKL